MKKTLNIAQRILLILLLTFCFGIGNSMADDVSGPYASTIAASSITVSSATLNGVVHANGGATSVLFEYGPITDYEFQATAIPGSIPGANSEPVPVQLPITGLVENTLYHFRVSATNDSGTAYGQDMTFFAVTPSLPFATTTPASSVTSLGATLNGSVDSGGIPAIVTFQYGTTTGYGTTVTATPNPVTSTNDVDVSATLSELQVGTTYHYRVSATNSVGTSFGSDRTFTTPLSPPSVITDAATSVSSASAMLNGTVNAVGSSTTVTFEYGETSSYGATVTAEQNPVSGSISTPVSRTLSGLSTGTTYHYRVVGVNIAGTTNGSDMTFSTSVAGPLAITIEASEVQLFSVTLNGTVNANNNSTTVSFQFGQDTAYTRFIPATPSVVAGDSNTQVTLNIDNLVPRTTYYYRVVARHGDGTTSYGSNYSFTTKDTFPWSLFPKGITEKQ